MIKIDNYYLNLDKLNKLEKEEKNRIYDMYRDMVFSFDEKRTVVASSYFTTLFHSGYLIDSRNEKIEELLNGNGIDT